MNTPAAVGEMTDEQELRKVRFEWYDAYFRGDTAVLARLETSDFVVISDRSIESQREYAEIQQAVQENRWIPKGATLVEDEVNLRVQGNMAIIYSRGWTRIPDVAEKRPAYETVATEVWIKCAGNWRVMHLHYH